jgi:hypothetical protein
MPAGSKEPAISLRNVKGAMIRNSRVDPSGATLLLSGIGTADVVVGTGVIPPANEVEREARQPRAAKPAPRARAPGKKAAKTPRKKAQKKLPQRTGPGKRPVPKRRK